MKIRDLKNMMKDIKFINEATVKLEYHKENTLSDDRKKLHRDILLPKLNETMEGMNDIVEEMCVNLPEDMELPSDPQLEAMIETTKVYKAKCIELLKHVDGQKKMEYSDDELERLK